MSVRTSIDALGRALTALGGSLDALSRRALDNPPANALPLAQSVGDAGDAMAGWVAEARAALRARKRPETGVLRAHQRALWIAGALDEWTGYERIADIVAAGQEGRRRGREWALELRDALESSRAGLASVQRRVLESWQELVEARLSGGISLQAVSVGQQVSLAGDRPVTNADLTTTGGETGAVGS
jgi:hypothetical protein